jgi:large subunit ribosomal protein L7/L12
MKQKTKSLKGVIIMADKKKETKKDLSKAVEKLVDEISKLTVVELSQLVDALQDKLGVSAMPVAAAPAGGAAPEAEGEKEEAAGGANQTVVITGAGDNKIAVIKAIREIDQNLGLKEAKDMTENLPAEVLKDAKAEDATAAADKLKAAGATVELK